MSVYKVQKYQANLSKFIVVSLLLIVLSACVSKKYSRIGLKYEQTEMYGLAVDNYITSLQNKDKGNDAARIGLMRSAKRYSDELEQRIDKAYSSLNDNEVVSNYLALQKLSNKADLFQVDIPISPKAQGQFEESKTRHLRVQYAKAQELLDTDRFSEAETYLYEVLQIDKNYERTAELYNFARCEPVYRDAKQMYQSKLYRSAYFILEKLLQINPLYKDAAAMHKESLQYAILTIAIQPPANYRNYPFLASYIEESTKSLFVTKANPLLKIVSPDYTQQMLNERRLALTNNLPFDASLVIPVRVYLAGNIISSNYSTSKVQTVTKQAYLRTEDKNKRIQFKKINYSENSQSAKATIEYKYELLRVENSIVIGFNNVNKTYTDNINYAVSNYDFQDLYPFDVRKGLSDTIYLDTNRANSFRRIFQARNTLVDKSEFEKDFAKIVSEDVYNKMNYYNPEK